MGSRRSTTLKLCSAFDYLDKMDSSTDEHESGGEDCPYCFVDETSYCPRCNEGVLSWDPVLQQVIIKPQQDRCDRISSTENIFKSDGFRQLLVLVLNIISWISFFLVDVFLTFLIVTIRIWDTSLNLFILTLSVSLTTLEFIDSVTYDAIHFCAFWLIVNLHAVIFNFFVLLVAVSFQIVNSVFMVVGNIVLLIWALLLYLILSLIYISWLLLYSYTKVMFYNKRFLVKQSQRPVYIKFHVYSAKYRSFMLKTTVQFRLIILFFLDQVDIVYLYILGMFRKAVKFKSKM